jgi:hypothetical protein
VKPLILFLSLCLLLFAIVLASCAPGQPNPTGRLTPNNCSPLATFCTGPR